MCVCVRTISFDCHTGKEMMSEQEKNYLLEVILSVKALTLQDSKSVNQKNFLTTVLQAIIMKYRLRDSYPDHYDFSRGITIKCQL